MRTAPASPRPRAALSAPPRGRLVALIVTATTLVGLAAVSPPALLIVLRHGCFAAGIVVSAAGLGLVAMRILRLPAAPLRWLILGATGLGLGLLSLLVLALGAAGLLHRPIWFALLALFFVAGVPCLLKRRGQENPSPPDGERNGAGRDEAGDAWMGWLWLGAVAFALLAALAATMPPGTIWPEEGNGYDVLEYHLGAPREYLEAGRISYLPHNIYSNLPLNVEMLYLLAMVLHGDAASAAFTANMLHWLLGVIVVASIWLGGREYGRGPGIVAALAAASCPFLAYLCGLAYNENGVLMFTALAVAAALRTEKLPPEQGGRWWALAGLFCGFACGCKYTAIPMVFLPLALAAARRALGSAPRRPGQAIVFIAAAAVAFSPWLIRNAVATGNPVFPLARGVFPERPGIWDDDGAARWHEGHLPAPEDRWFAQRLARLGNEVLHSKMYGPLPLLALVLGGAVPVINAIRRRQNPNRAAGRDGEARSHTCWFMIIICVAAWLTFTHLAGRFAVVLIVPLSLITGLAWRMVLRPAARIAAGAALAATLAMNAWTVAGFFTTGDVSLLKTDFFGRMDLVTEGHWPGHQHVPKLNEILSRDEKVLMVGDARRFYLDRGVDYCVVFNRNPFADAAARLPPEALMGWLRERQYRYVYVDWSEMHRLRTTRYGFWPSIDAALFTRLSEAGLHPQEHFQPHGHQNPYATLFRVPPDRP